MIDCILAIWVLTERRREFQQGMLAADVDLCKAFHPVNQDALWRILDLCGVPPKLINLISELYSGTENAVIQSPTYFQLLLEFVRGVHWPPQSFQHLCGLDSGEDVGEIKLQCIVWECQDL